MSRGARITILTVVLAAVALAVGGYAVARWRSEQRPSLGTLVYESYVTDRAHFRGVELGPGDTIDRLGVELDDGQDEPDLPPLADGERRFGFVSHGCTLTDPVLAQRASGLYVDWVYEPGVSCSPEPARITIFDVDAAVVPPGTDLGGASVGVLDDWHRLDGASRVQRGPEVVSHGGGTSVVRAVVAGCQEERPPFLNTVDGELVAGFPDLGREVQCEAPEYYAATFRLSTFRLKDVTGPAPALL